MIYMFEVLDISRVSVICLVGIFGQPVFFLWSRYLWVINCHIW